MKIDKALKKEHRTKQEEEKEKYADIYKDQDLIFCTLYGTPMNPSNIRNRIMNPAIEESDVTKIRFHDLRHTCATILLLNGAPVKAVSERLGHKSIKVTLQTYAHVLPSTSQQIADQMDGILNLTTLNSSLVFIMVMLPFCSKKYNSHSRLSREWLCINVFSYDSDWARTSDLYPVKENVLI